MSYNNEIDDGIKLLRDLQSMIFDENIEKNALFEKTVEINNILDKASINYNKYINNK